MKPSFLLKTCAWVIMALSSCAVATAQNIVTFRVDMSVQAAQGPFDPAADVVEARGVFNGWSGGFELADANKDNIYEGAFDLPNDMVGKPVEYKYVFLRNGVTHWEDAINNRTFTLAAGKQTLDKVFFQNDSEVDKETKGEMHFEVDMNVQIATRKFAPGVDEVYVRGNKMGWGSPPSGLLMKEDPKRPGVYVAGYKMEEALVGDVIKYKYTIWRPATEATVWEGGADKDASLKATDKDVNGDGYVDGFVSLSYFDGVSFNGILRVDTAVTFRVDMSQAAANQIPFDPANEGVWINGQFLSWWSWGSQPEEHKMHDDGKTGGDEKAGDKIYSYTRVFKQGDARKVEYKYGVEGGDNEAGFAMNHVRYINADGKYLMPVDVFGDMQRESGPKVNNTPAPPPVISISRAAKGFSLGWTAADGAAFDIEHSDGLAGTSWKIIASDVKVAAGKLSFEDGDVARVGKPLGFYRAKVK